MSFELEIGIRLFSLLMSVSVLWSAYKLMELYVAHKMQNDIKKKW